MNFKDWLLLTEKIIIKDQEFRDPLHALKHIQNTHSNPENLVVTYTAIDKVGINPRSEYKTPLGIYFYPLNYVIEKEMKVPFAGDKPYINVCEFANPNKILHMTSDASNQKGLELLDVFPKEEVEKAIMKINPKKTLEKPLEEMIKKAQEYNDYRKTKLNNPQYDQEKDNDLYKKYIDARNYYDNLKNELGVNYLAPNEKYSFYSNYSELWIATRILAYGKPILWNKNLRKCGIDGFVDHGTATIHKNEKTQGVVFAADALKLLHSIPNYNTKLEPNYKYITNKITDDQFIKMLKYRRDLNIRVIISQANNKSKMAELIINNKPELSDNDVESLLLYAEDKDKDKIAELIIEKNPEISDQNVIIHLIDYAKNKDKIAELLQKEDDNISKLSDDNVNMLLSLARDKDKIAKIIIKYKKELSSNNFFSLLYYAKDKDHIAELLQKEEDNISKLSHKSVSNLLSTATNKKQMAQILNKYHQNKTPEIQEEIDKYLS